MHIQPEDFDSDAFDQLWARLNTTGAMADPVVDDAEDEAYVDTEPRFPFDEDKLAYWGGLRMVGWTLEEMLSQGMIDIATYPFEDEPPEQEASVPTPPICVREYTPEELEQFEIIPF